MCITMKNDFSGSLKGQDMNIFDLNQSIIFEPIQQNLIERIRHFQQKHNIKQVFAWLFVHGMEEGNAFELGIAPALESPTQFMKEAAEFHHSYWDFVDLNEPDDFGGTYALHGIYEWQEQWQDGVENDNAIAQLPRLVYQDWQLVPLADFEIETIGFIAQEAENVFIQRVYTDILRSTLKLYPIEIQGFILEMHDSALPIKWIDQTDFQAT